MKYKQRECPITNSQFKGAQYFYFRVAIPTQGRRRTLEKQVKKNWCHIMNNGGYILGCACLWSGGGWSTDIDKIIFFPAFVACLGPGWAVMSAGVVRVRSTVTTALLFMWSHALLPFEIHYRIRSISSCFCAPAWWLVHGWGCIHVC